MQRYNLLSLLSPIAMSDDLTTAEATRKVSLWEKHFQTIAIAVTLMVVGYIGTRLVESKDKETQTAATLLFLSQQLSDFKLQSGKDIAELKGLVQTMQSNYVSREDFRDHEARLRQLEQRERKER